MSWLPLDTWIVIIAALCAAACAIPGCFLVLRKMSMMGDAISHAVLPGLAIAFMVTGSRSSAGMFVGAAATGIVTAVFTQWVHRFGRVEQGAAMGVVFTSLFAVGLVLMAHAADSVDLDPGCVLYGALELTPLDVVATLSAGGWIIEVPRAALTLAAVLAFNIGLVWLFFKELKLVSFDADLASSLGFHANRLHYLLMVMVAVTAVAAFEVVGSILVIAMLVVPPATALLLTSSLWGLLLVSVLVGIASAAIGHVLALLVPMALGFPGTSSAGMVATVSGLLFFIAWGVHRWRMRTRSC